MQDMIRRSHLREQRSTNNPTPPRRGQLLADYTLTRTDGTTFLLSDFRGKQNLVLIFLEGLQQSLEAPQAQLLQSLAESSGEVRENETRVIVVAHPGQLPTVQAIADGLLAAADQSGKAFSDVAAAPGTTIYITDKFREVFHVYRIPSGETLPNAAEILGWVRFVAMQCPECHPPEWPAEAL